MVVCFFVFLCLWFFYIFVVFWFRRLLLFENVLFLFLCFVYLELGCVLFDYENFGFFLWSFLVCVWYFVFCVFVVYFVGEIGFRRVRG